MQKVDINELKEIINAVKDAVDQSDFGPLFMYPNEVDFTEKQVNQLAWNLYLNLVAPIVTCYAKDMMGPLK